MNKVKIGFLCGSKAWGGLEMNQLRNALRFIKLNFEIVIFCKKDSVIYEKAKQQNIPIVLIPEHRRYKYFFAGLTFSKLLNIEKITHLIVRDSKDLNICSIAKTFSKQRFHLSYFMEMQLGVSKRNLLHTARYNKIDAWICPLNYLKKQVITHTKFNPTKIHVIPSAIEEINDSEKCSRSDFLNKYHLKSNRFVFAIVGRIDPLKGQLETVKAFYKLKNKENCSLIIVGETTKHEESTYLSEIQDYIEKHKLTNYIHFIPHQENIQALYSCFDVVIMASHSETFGMVTLEALSNGVPVIGSNAGGTPELLNFGKYGLLFDTKNSNDLSLKMQFMLENPNFFSKEKLIAYSKNFQFDIVFKKIKEILF